MIRPHDMEDGDRQAMLFADDNDVRERWAVLGVHINPNTDCGAMSWVAIGDSKRTYARVGFSWRIGGSQCGDNQADREKIAQQICDAVNAMGGI